MALLTVYQDEQYKGRALELDDSSPALPSGFNDKVTSFHLAKGKSAVFYSDVHYSNELFRVPGDYDYDCPGLKPEHGDRASSIRLYETSDFKAQL